MRKETYKIAHAFLTGRPAKAARTHTDGQTVWLHNNRIAWRNKDHDVCFTLAGWPTVTTRERLNGLLNVFGQSRWGVTQRKHEQYLTFYDHLSGVEHMEPIGDNEVISFNCLQTFEKEYKLC
tara:strand:- start:233 stop:598 length:366 start_codon:yes stop_codon:yes gene_type:complete